MNVTVCQRKSNSIVFKVSFEAAGLQTGPMRADITIEFGAKKPGQQEKIDSQEKFKSQAIPKSRVMEFEIKGLAASSLYKFIFSGHVESIAAPFRFVLMTSTTPSSGMTHLDTSNRDNLSTGQKEKEKLSSTRPRIDSKDPKKKLTMSEKHVIDIICRTGGMAEMLGGKSSLTRSIKQARKTRHAEEFSKSGYKFSRPPSMRQERMARTLIVSSAKESTYSLTSGSKGKEFMKNDWFMGPFYAWDKNVAIDSRKYEDDQDS